MIVTVLLQKTRHDVIRRCVKETHGYYRLLLQKTRHDVIGGFVKETHDCYRAPTKDPT